MPIREIKFPPKVMRRARKIRVLLMDVDGTMTSGAVSCNLSRMAASPR